MFLLVHAATHEPLRDSHGCLVSRTTLREAQGELATYPYAVIVDEETNEIVPFEPEPGSSQWEVP